MSAGKLGDVGGAYEAKKAIRRTFGLCLKDCHIVFFASWTRCRGCTIGPGAVVSTSDDMRSAMFKVCYSKGNAEVKAIKNGRDIL